MTELRDTRSATAPAEGPLSITEVGVDRLDTIRELNVAIFDEERVINTFDRDGLLMLVAFLDERPVGFKVGYQLHQDTFYSAKGGVLPAYRRRGIARELLYVMMEHVRHAGYRRFVYDTFPNKHAGMTILGLVEGFRVTKAGYSPQYSDYRLRLEQEL